MSTPQAFTCAARRVIAHDQSELHHAETQGICHDTTRSHSLVRLPTSKSSRSVSDNSVTVMLPSMVSPSPEVTAHTRARVWVSEWIVGRSWVRGLVLGLRVNRVGVRIRITVRVRVMASNQL